MLHDKQCTDGNVAFEPKLHLQQTIPLLCLEPYKHLKTIKLNPWAREDVFLVHPQCALVVVGSLQRSSSWPSCLSTSQHRTCLSSPSTKHSIVVEDLSIVCFAFHHQQLTSNVLCLKSFNCSTFSIYTLKINSVLK